MKRMSVLLALVLVLTASNAFAHDKGDLMLNIEPQIGFAYPYPSLMFEKGMNAGLDLAIRATVHYYFVDFFAINAGFGYSFNINMFATNGSGIFYGSYFNIPVGFRFSYSAFAAGAGIVGNIPFYVFGTYAPSSKNNYDNEIITFDGKPHIGWYADTGLDLSGRAGKTGGFGILARVGGSFAREIATPSSSSFRDYNPYRFSFITASVVFQAAIQVASLPIGKAE